MNIKNSSGKIIGEIIWEKEIIIRNNSKPELIITDTQIIEKIKEKDLDTIVFLYDELTLTVAEIAALYGVCYSNMNKKLKQLPVKTQKKSGRRNSSYGTEFSKERKENISKSLTGRKLTYIYERTPEIKEKISKSLKDYFKQNGVSEETRQKLSDAWKRGCYKNSPMGRGIQGFMYSIKNKRTFFFRSLLELKFFIDLENNEKVINYSVEPFQIKLENNHHYTPDVLINNEFLVELKSRKNVQLYENKERFEMEQRSANEYCQKHNLSFQVVYDDEIGFETKKYKKFLKDNPNIIEKYQINFHKDIWS